MRTTAVTLLRRRLGLLRSSSAIRVWCTHRSTVVPPARPVRSFSSAAAIVADTNEETSNTAGVTQKDEQHEESQRRRLSEVKISEVLQAKHSYRWVDPVLPHDAALDQAIVAVIEGGLSGAMVVQHTSEAKTAHQRRVVGLLTSRDLLRIVAQGIQQGDSAEDCLKRPVTDYMTPISQVIYARPEETVGVARTLMAKLGIKCLPVLSRQGQVQGLLTARDMSDFGLSAQDKGGKSAYLRNVSERVGLSSNTSMAEPPTYVKAHLALEQSPLYMNVGVAALPHPFKGPDGSLARNLRDMNFQDFSNDPSVSEDSHFITTVTLPADDEGPPRKFTYLGVADGVGSWREYGVDPRAFSHRLMEECENSLLEASRNGSSSTEGRPFRSVVSPAQVLAQAYERVKADNIIGSSTACVALFDSVRHQLHFSNLGDSGLIVLRHIDSDVAGSLKRERHVPRTERKSDLRLAFVSQQQLRSFNHPYQLGWTGDEASNEEAVSFKTAREACTSSVHLRRGDIIIMATDGLFDNVDVDDICEIALEWEQSNGFLRGGDIASRDRRWAMGNSLTLLSSEVIDDLAQRLAHKARENSLDNTKDSPFAILAKENDVMWSGGMPDDTTVLALHVVGRDAEDMMDQTHK